MNPESFFSKAWRDVTRNILGLFNFTARKSIDKAAGASAATAPLTHLWGLGASYLIDAYINYRDYKHEEERLRAFFEPEIAAKLGKRPEMITAQDMHEVAKDNPVIRAAVKRNKKDRDVNFGVSAVSITGAVFATSAILAFFPALSAAAVFFAGMAIGLPIFLAGEAVFGRIGKKIFGLDEPDLRDVGKNPALQHKLSLPGQIRFLDRLQAHRTPVTEQQVFQTFVTANPELARQIASRYGAPFADLPPGVRGQVVNDMGSTCDITRLTQDINTRLIRPQELAFTLCGQSSGVTKLESPHLSRLEKTQAELQQKLASAQQKIGELSAQVKDRTVQFSEKVAEKGRGLVTAAREKLPFMKSHVSAAVPENQFTAKETLRSGAQQQAAL